MMIPHCNICNDDKAVLDEIPVWIRALSDNDHIQRLDKQAHVCKGCQDRLLQAVTSAVAMIGKTHAKVVGV